MEKDVRLSRLKKKKKINDRRTESEGQKSGLCVKDKGGSHQPSLCVLRRLLEWAVERTTGRRVGENRSAGGRG